MKKILLLTVLISLTLIGSAQSQITGRVIDPDGGALPGVNVIIQGTTNGTLTDIDGKYSINASSSDVLVFSFIGYADEVIQIQDQSVINVTMKEDVQSLDEVVIIGYGTAKKKELTGATVQVGGEDVRK